MSQFTIVRIEDNEIFYLNHSCMSTHSFGSEEMAWTTKDREKAELMLFKVQNGNTESVVEIQEF